LIAALFCSAALAGAQEHGGAASAAPPQAARSAASGPPPAAGAQQPAAASQGAAAAQPGQEPRLAEASQEAAEEKPFKLFGKWVIPGPVVAALRWANFVILFGLLGWLLRKPLAAFLRQRGRMILKALQLGRRARQEAAARLDEINARLAGLESDIAELRRQALAEAQAERDRLRDSAIAEAARILTQAEQDIDAFAKAARNELRRYAAQLAVELAEQRIRTQMTGDRHAAMVRYYAASLK
jgi:F-type H+-transporting ATPase subunit b